MTAAIILALKVARSTLKWRLSSVPWCQRMDAGEPRMCGPQHPDARTFDVLGALERAADSGQTLSGAESVLSCQLPESAGGLLLWAEGKTEEQILAVFESAIARSNALWRAEKQRMKRA